MKVHITRRRATRTFVLVVIVICLSRENVWDVAYKLLIVSLHGIWECMDSPLPMASSFKPSALVKLAKEGLFELAKR